MAGARVATRRRALPLLAAASIAWTLSAQDVPRPDPGQPFVERVEVDVVNVDVHVTDKKGKFVAGLDRDDFEVLEDGRPVRISNFYAVTDGRPSDGAGPSGARPRAPADPRLRRTQLAKIELPEDQRLYIVVYFDNVFLKPFSRNRAVREVRRFLHENATPQDLVQIVTYDRGLHIRQPLTNNLTLVGEELFRIEKLSAFAVQKETERRDVIRRIQGSRTAGEAVSHVDFHAKSVYQDMTFSIRAMRQIIAGLAGLPGRKAFLHITDGVPMTAAEELFHFVDTRFPDELSGRLLASRYSGRRLYQELAAHANANRVTFYTLEAAGLRSHGTLSAEYGSLGNQGLAEGSMIEVDFMRLANEQETLQFLADDTGGLSAFNTNNLAGALDRMAQDLRSYYSLGYVSGNSGDGRYHRIEVRVKRRGLQVRHRNGYRAKTIETRISEGTLAALLYDQEQNPLDIRLELGRGAPGESGHFLVPVVVRIPIGRLTFVPQMDRHEGRLKVAVAAVDSEGRTSPVEQTPVPLSIPDADLEEARQKDYVYAVELLMRRGDQKVAVGVRDEIGGIVSYIDGHVTVGR